MKGRSGKLAEFFGAPAVNSVQLFGAPLMLVFLAVSPIAYALDDYSADSAVEKYTAKISLNVAAQRVEGQTVMKMRPSHLTSAELRFPLFEKKIEKVQWGGLPVSYKLADQEIVISVPEKSKQRRGDLSISYSVDKPPGLFFSTNHVYSAFSTCRWMVCSLASGARAKFRLELTVPQDYKVFASGRFVSRMPVSAQRSLHIWEETRPYSPYLFGFAAGTFVETSEVHNDFTLGYWGIDETPATLRRKFADTPRMLAYFEHVAGVRLPHKSYTQVLVPGSQAQEVSTYSVIGKDQLDPILEDPHEDWVIAHELAHQWWGNLITCKDWSHFWLNEAVVTFLVATYKEERWGKPDYERELSLAERRYQIAKDANFDVPLSFSGNYPSLQIKRSITYSKGMLFLHALRKELGEEAFWSGMRLYSTRHLGQLVTSRDFQRAMEEASGRDLSDTFDQWVFVGAEAKPTR